MTTPNEHNNNNPAVSLSWRGLTCICCWRTGPGYCTHPHRGADEKGDKVCWKPNGCPALKRDKWANRNDRKKPTNCNGYRNVGAYIDQGT